MLERIFRVTPLTPVHVGTGETYSRDEYTIDKDQLVRLNLAAILGSWAPDRRRQFERAIEASNLRQARQMLEEASRGRPEFELYRVPLAPAALQELEQAKDPAQRRGEVHPLYRNPITQEPVLPGSSIKGAIRTAIVNAWAAYDAELHGRIREALPSRRKTAWQELEEGALRYDRSRTESDPLSLLRVSDGTFPAAAARVDRVLVRNRQGDRRQRRRQVGPRVDRVLVRNRQGREAGRGIQMHYERLIAVSDGGRPPSCMIRVGLDERRMRHSRSPVLPRLDFDFLVGACDAFYRGRYEAEMAQFPWLRPRGGGWLPPSPPGGFVVRVGRFCHFESLSVDGVRSGWNAQARRSIEGMGSSRSVISTGNGFVPFGWLLLEPAGSC